ncbi:unnamed protein product, partial [Scytosiphon promiscuus]
CCCCSHRGSRWSKRRLHVNHHSVIIGGGGEGRGCSVRKRTGGVPARRTPRPRRRQRRKGRGGSREGAPERQEEGSRRQHAGGEKKKARVGGRCARGCRRRRHDGEVAPRVAQRPKENSEKGGARPAFRRPPRVRGAGGYGRASARWKAGGVLPGSKDAARCELSQQRLLQLQQPLARGSPAAEEPET